MASENAQIDDNRRKALLGVTDDANEETRNLLVDPDTGRLKVSATLSGIGTMSTVKEGGTQLGGADIATLDFDGTDFNLTESPDTEVNITVNDGGIDHDSLANFTANEHIDWTGDQGATNIHSGNIPDLSATYAVASKGVTGGDSHDHSGGDGASIPDAALSSGATVVSAGAADSGKLAKLDAAGHIDASAINDADINLDSVTEGTTNKSYTATEQSKLSGIEASADVTDATNVAAAGAVMEGDTTTASMSFVVDEDTMASNLDTKVPTQQSVKAYVDTSIPTASTTTAGKAELATTAETTAGTDTGRVVTPDGLSGSIYGRKTVILKVIADDTALTTGDGKMFWTVPVDLNGMNLVDIDACVYTVSSSGLPSIALYNVTDSQDMLSVNCTIDATEFSSYTATTAPTINATYDDVATGDRLRIDVDASGTGTKGLEIHLIFQTP